MSYVKLSAEILDSTVWREAGHVRLVWIAMLAMKNEYQEVMASVPGLADRARVTRAECDDALAVLSSPDLDSRSQVEEGRRILPIPGGWFVVNGESYRRRESPDERRERKAAYMREHRAAKAVPPPDEVPRVPRVPNVDAATDHKRHVDNVDCVPPVTDHTGHVTACGLSGPAEAEQRQSKVRDPDLVEFALDGGRFGDVVSGTFPTLHEQVRQVFEFWRTDTGHTDARLTDGKIKHLRARLDDGFTVEQLCQVVRNRRLSPHYMGQNDTKTVYDGIDNLFRNTERVEKLLALSGSAARASGTQATANGEAYIYDPGN